MNTPLDNEPEDLRYAEYVLGVLDADARAAVEREIASEPRAATEVEYWERQLLPLAEDVQNAMPADHVWTRIQSQLGWSQPARHARPVERERQGWWNSLSVWRGFALGAAAVAAACIIALIVLPPARVANPVAPGVAYMASTITQTNGNVGWTATVDLQHARMVVVPARPQALPAGRAAELWLIPAGQKPVAVGLIHAGAPTTLQLDNALANRIGPNATLAVSVEPPGGSPTGQPTGPVIGKGSISGT